MHTSEENGITNELSYSFSVTDLKHLVRLQSCDGLVHYTPCKMLFCAKTIVKESHNFELAHLKTKRRRNKEKHFGHLWFGIFAMFLSYTVCPCYPTNSVITLPVTHTSIIATYSSQQYQRREQLVKYPGGYTRCPPLSLYRQPKQLCNPVAGDSKLLHTVGKWTHVCCSMELRAPLNPSCLHTTWAFFSLQGVVRESAQTVPHIPLWHTSTCPALDCVMDLVWTSRTSPSWLVEQGNWAAEDWKKSNWCYYNVLW